MNQHLETVKKLKHSLRVAILSGVAGLSAGLVFMLYVMAVTPTTGAESVLSITGMCGLIGSVVGFVLASTRDDGQ
jgi:hypothetical protein